VDKEKMSGSESLIRAIRGQKKMSGSESLIHAIRLPHSEAYRGGQKKR
jgi:hypothetical protein